MITIVDYGVGNLAAVHNMLKKCGVNSVIESHPEGVASAQKIILPGVGAFDAAIKKIDELRLRDAITSAAKNGSFILGICLGAQLLMQGSDEGNLTGLALINGYCKKFDVVQIAPLKIPHMGWSEVDFKMKKHPLGVFKNDPRFYFSHSYYLQCDRTENILATCEYGMTFTCAVVNNNVMGVQFHPEKSHVFGAQLLTNFAAM